MSWKTLALVLAALCVVQTYRACSHTSPATPAAAQADCPAPSTIAHSRHTGFAASDEAAERAVAETDEEPAAPAGPSFNGIKLPAWTLYFAPQPGESMLSYRDRMVPLAQAALAPHRARVVRGLDDFAAKVKLDPQQRAQLDASVQEAASAIQDEVMSSLLSGQLTPKTFNPMTVVTLARDVLDSIDKANQRFMASLREDQKATLAGHPFDFADYLLFSARWEDALGVTN
jgi:hypothetical protein